jgi:hypothetical protein
MIILEGPCIYDPLEKRFSHKAVIRASVFECSGGQIGQHGGFGARGHGRRAITRMGIGNEYGNAQI